MALSSHAEFEDVLLIDLVVDERTRFAEKPIGFVAKSLLTGRTNRRWFAESLVDVDVFGRCKAPLAIGFFNAETLRAIVASGLFGDRVVLINLRCEFARCTAGLDMSDLDRGDLDLVESAQLMQLNSVRNWRGRADDFQVTPPVKPEDRRHLLDAAEARIGLLEEMYSKLVPDQLTRDQAAHRGKFCILSSQMELNGIPVDVEAYERITSCGNLVIDELIRKCPIAREAFRDHKLHPGRLSTALRNRGLPTPPEHVLSHHNELRGWLKTTGRLEPKIERFRQVHKSRQLLKMNPLSVGSDRRCRGDSRPFRSKTGRSQPLVSENPLYGPSWRRSIVRPAQDRAIVYADYCQQEFGIAAYLSGDRQMIQAYESGDPYRAASRVVDERGHWASQDRGIWKIVCIALQYGMGADKLAEQLGVGRLEARSLIQSHRQKYAAYWEWSKGVVDDAYSKNMIQSQFGWQLHIANDTKGTTVQNFPLQANGAEIMRRASIRIVECGLRLCGTVHDAFMVECSSIEANWALMRLSECLRQASIDVLGGPGLRFDAKVIKHPERLRDPRGERLWQVVYAAAQIND